MRDNGGAADEIVYKRIVERSNEISIDQALKMWLRRTPIYGSLPGDPADDILVTRFVEKYLKAFDEATLETQKVSNRSGKTCVLYFQSPSTLISWGKFSIAPSSTHSNTEVC